MKKQKTRILIIEDSDEWAIKLYKMYEEIFQKTDIKLEVCLETSGNKALERLSSESFDLISLDINLSNTHPLTKDNQINLEIKGADGRDVLLCAHEKTSCKGVIVITGLQQDEKLDVVIPNEEEREVARITLGFFLEKLFPGRNLYFHKGQKLSPEACIKTYKEYLTYEGLLRLYNDLSFLPPPYSIQTFECKKFIQIKSNSNSAAETITLHNRKYVELFYKMVDEEVEPITYASVCAICRPKSKNRNEQQVAHSCMQNFRRYLESQRLDSNALFESIPERGWRLLPDISIQEPRRPRKPRRPRG